MNTEYRYILEKGSKKFICPQCGKKTFKRYIDTETNEYLPEQYGRCDRESKCTYHLNPYLDGYAKTIWDQDQKVTKVTKVTIQKQKYFHAQPEQPEPVFFDFETFKKTLQPERYEKNTFIQNLLNRVQFPFEADEVTKVIKLYRLGTVANGYRVGAITFPYIDINNNVRAIQVKQFDKHNHTTSTDFLHSILIKYYNETNKPLPEWLEAYTKQDKIITCLFGEHLLNKYPNNPVALVEAPKTAIYGTLYFGLPETPESLIWLAVYNKSSFTLDKLKILQGRFVYVFPDLSKDGSTFKEWEAKAKEFESCLPKTQFIFSDLLEKLAPEQDKNEGYDIADYLIKQDWRLFRKHDIKEQTPQPEPEKVTKVTKVTPQTNTFSFHVSPTQKINEVTKVTKVTPQTNTFSFHVEQPLQNWDDDISELEAFFKDIKLPAEPIILEEGVTITNCLLFVESHFATVKASNGNITFLPYLNRLKEFKQLLMKELN